VKLSAGARYTGLRKAEFLLNNAATEAEYNVARREARALGVDPDTVPLTIEKVLRQTDCNKSKTARQLGLTRTQLYVRLQRYGLENPLPL
jgi:DNA-binding NtrC family response regulator